MHLLFADQWLSPSLIQALGWTLIHSLWEGFVVAMIALVMLWATKKGSPALRYNLLLLLFGIFVVAVTVTFFTQYKGQAVAKADHAISTSLTKAAMSPVPTVPLSVTKQTNDYVTAFESLVNRNATLIVSIWFAIFCIQCLRLSFSLGYIYRIRHFKTYRPASNWQELCTTLKKGFGIQRHVTLLESGIVKVPLVIGFFKPLILLPVGLLANLPYSQVESILLHELAHIRRRDYLINLLQTLVETLFFFNPAALWISSLIKEEREACCDAMAVNHLDSKSHYIQALVSFEEYSINPSGYAMAFPGRKSHLLQRVKRIISNENKKLTSMEKLFLFCGIVAVLFFSLFSTKEGNAQGEAHKTILAPANSALDTIPENKPQNAIAVTNKKQTRTRITTDNDGQKKVTLLETNNLDGKDAKARIEANRLTQLSINGTDINPRQFVLYEEKVKGIIDEQQRASTRAEHQVHTQVKQNADAKKPIPEKNGEKDNDVTSQPQSSLSTTQMSSAYSGSEDSHQQVDDMLQTLKGAGIIQGKESISFKLTYDQLIVNGVRQPSELHQALKQKYIYKQGDYYTFLSSAGTTDITVHRAD